MLNAQDLSPLTMDSHHPPRSNPKLNLSILLSKKSVAFGVFFNLHFIRPLSFYRASFYPNRMLEEEAAFGVGLYTATAVGEIDLRTESGLVWREM